MTGALSNTHLSYLKIFGPDTYGLEIPHSIAKTLEIKGLVEWVPPKFGTTLYAITNKGRAAVRRAAA
jgi:hypothetical protein